MRERGSTLCTRPLGLALLLACGLSIARANYLFTEEPIARLSPALGDTDLFGYAVALHRLDNTGATTDFDHAITNTKILVGAPNGTFPGGLTLSVDDSEALNRTGLVYICPITPGDCESVSGNGMGNDIRLFDYEGNSLPNDADGEEKEGQFMGATIVSTGDHVTICAPRWISLASTGEFGPFDKTRAHGRCFYSGRELTDFKVLRPCEHDTSQSQVGEAYCMAGTAASMYEREPSKFTVFLGGPPYDDSAGIVFQYDLTDNIASTAFEFIPSENTSQIFWYSGLSVTTGRILNSNERDLVYSLPKKNIYRGTVEVFSLSSKDVRAEVFGKQMGEYFGWVVATADLNGDNFDEIIVGAPLFSTPDEIEKGRVFIFKNNGTLDTENPIIITGTVGKGRFGSAIVNVGDINDDGFEDVAISAPYEEQEDEAEGTVYVYLGSGDDVINRNPVDTITARAISNTLGLELSLKTFGFTLSSGVDVDANLYNDLVIGSYEQQAVVLLRARSIATISLSLSTIPGEQFEYFVQSCPSPVGEDMFACFDLVISASFSGRGLDGRPLNTRFVVSEDAVPEGARLFFLDSDGNRADTFTGELNFDTTNKTKTTNVTVYVENDLVDRRTNLAVVVGVFSPERQPRPVDGRQDIIDLRDIPILTVLPQNNMIAQLSLAGCANPVCMPLLQLTLNETRYLDVDQGRTGYTNIVAGGVSYVEVVLDYQTLTDHAINTTLTLNFSNSRLVDPPRSITSTVALPTPQCPRVDGKEDIYTCQLQPIFSEHEGVLQVTILIPVQEVIGNEGDDYILFEIVNENMVSDGTVGTEVVVRLSTSAFADVTFQDLAVSPSMTQYEDNDQLGTLIRTTATFDNSGPSTIPSAKLTVYLPGRVEDYYYLYPASATSALSMTCSGLNPENRTFNNQRKRKRATPPHGIERESRMVEGDEGREITETVNCSSTPTQCTAIECSLSNVERGVHVVTIRSNVDNRFFRTQTGDFEFYAYATFEILQFVGGENSSIISNKFLVQETPPSKDKPIQVWVYIVSCLGALIILAFLVLLLYLVGFFRLRRKEAVTKEYEHLQQPGQAPASSAEPTSLDTKPEKPEKPEELDELDEKPSDGSPTKSEEAAERSEDNPDETQL